MGLRIEPLWVITVAYLLHTQTRMPMPRSEPEPTFVPIGDAAARVLAAALSAQGEKDRQSEGRN